MSDQQWTELPGIRDFTFTAETTADPELIRLLRGAEKPPQGRPVQVDYRVPVKLSWWRRVWLWARRKPVPIVKRQVVIPNATVTTIEPEEDQ